MRNGSLTHGVTVGFCLPSPAAAAASPASPTLLLLLLLLPLLPPSSSRADKELGEDALAGIRSSFDFVRLHLKELARASQQEVGRFDAVFSLSPGQVEGLSGKSHCTAVRGSYRNASDKREDEYVVGPASAHGGGGWMVLVAVGQWIWPSRSSGATAGPGWP